MAAIAILDLLRRNPNFGCQTFSSKSIFSGASTAAAASFAITTPFAFGSLFGNGAPRISYCDAGTAALDEDYISSIRSASRNIFQHDGLNYTTKQYDIQLKPLFSAFYWKAFALTSVRSFLLFYLPLLEPRPPMDDFDDEEKPLDLVDPFKKSVKQIIRETSVITTRRVLERLAVHYVSQRMAWKLLKGHFLGVFASWVVQVGIDIYRFFSSISKPRDDNDAIDAFDIDVNNANYRAEQAEVLAKRLYGATVRCGASIIFASIGAGIGAILIRPSTGQWIGCTIGDLAGPVILAFCFEKFHLDL
ncbi:hypothetical protein PHJA_001353200 [Phtheirospermum japonicum]|uniref:Uncharacterized protein n=1 Tax=Phtheirospermum japonicum TaxID=374723 RepID=A0A830CCY2_9LAMI|nr:hypothetical protein PHJA_001353200 [Phtheirospermum japonicum]